MRNALRGAWLAAARTEDRTFAMMEAAAMLVHLPPRAAQSEAARGQTGLVLFRQEPKDRKMLTLNHP
jgi:hypothetical protein